MTAQDPSTDLENVNAAYVAMREERDRLREALTQAIERADSNRAAYRAMREERDRAVGEAERLRATSEAPTRWFVHVCPYCGKQYRAPGGHYVAGDGHATSCFHRHEGERGVVQPRLVRVEVVPAEPFELLPIPHDRPILTDAAKEEGR
jgi:hypothetical protein